MIQRAAKHCVSRIVWSKSGRASQEGTPPALPLTATCMLRQDHSRELLGKALGEIRIPLAKEQVFQSVAGASPCNVALHKWRIVLPAACALCQKYRVTSRLIQWSYPLLRKLGPKLGTDLVERHLAPLGSGSLRSRNQYLVSWVWQTFGRGLGTILQTSNARLQ